MKCMKLIAVSLIAAGLCMGCSDGGDGIPDAPVVNLPESKGENPFKGKTFLEGRHEKYVFSDDGKTVTCYYRDDDETDKFVPERQYRCSVDADKRELLWAVEKLSLFDNKLYTFNEFVSYAQSGKYSDDYKAELEAELRAGEITQKEFEEYLAEEQQWIDEESKNGFPSIKMHFSGRQRFAYTYENGTVDFEEQFEESSAYFDYDRNESSSDDFYIDDVSVDFRGYASVYISKRNDYSFRRKFYARSFSSSEKKIIFENRDDKNDTFTATYELEGSGNDTTITLSFTYAGQEFKPTLAFRPNDLCLTETQPE